MTCAAVTAVDTRAAALLMGCVGCVLQVYYFSKFQVKPANKQYATVKNDYELHFDNR